MYDNLQNNSEITSNGKIYFLYRLNVSQLKSPVRGGN